MQKAMTKLIKMSTTRSTKEILQEYEETEEKLKNATGRKRKFLDQALLCLEKEMSKAANDDSDDSDSSDSSDSSDIDSN